MSYTDNQKEPGRREWILRRRNKQPDTIKQASGKYIPAGPRKNLKDHNR